MFFPPLYSHLHSLASNARTVCVRCTLAPGASAGECRVLPWHRPPGQVCGENGFAFV
jgi:hypothetical protein